MLFGDPTWLGRGDFPSVLADKGALGDVGLAVGLGRSCYATGDGMAVGVEGQGVA